MSLSHELHAVYLRVLRRLSGPDLLGDRLERWDGGTFDQVLAIGKAAPAMAASVLPLCSQPREGFVLTREFHLRPHHHDLLWGLECWEAGHPLPDQRSLLATERLLAWIDEVRHPGHLLVLLSGGASSLLAQPRPPLDLADLRELNEGLLASGLAIEEINVVRKHLSMVKGGGLGQRLVERFSRVTQWIMGDIALPHPEDHLHLVGSGPTLADPTTRLAAFHLLDRLEEMVRPSLLRRCRLACKETTKDLRLKAELIADHRLVGQVARDELGERAAADPRWSSLVTSEVKELAVYWVKLALQLIQERFCGVLIATGEPTVHLAGQNSGEGGRCQELAVHVARGIAGLEGVSLLAGSTDGSDGPTLYAGAVVDGCTWPSMERALGADHARVLLQRHESSRLLRAVPGCLIETGPTGYNLNDVFLLAVGGLPSF